MAYLLQMGLIYVIWQLGEFLASRFSLFIPGPILVMLILFTLLQTGLLKEKYIKKAGDLLLKVLPFFFIPSGVAILAYTDLIAGIWPYLLLTLLISFVLTLLASAKTSQLILRRKEKKLGFGNHKAGEVRD